MSIRPMIFALIVSCIAAGCIDEGSSTQDSTEAVPEYSEPAPKAPETVSYFAGNNFRCQSILGLGVHCLGFVNIVGVLAKISDVQILDQSKLAVLVSVLDDAAILNQNVIDVATILKNINIAILNVFIKDFNVLNIDDLNVNACSNLLSPHGHAHCH